MNRRKFIINSAGLLVPATSALAQVGRGLLSPGFVGNLNKASSGGAFSPSDIAGLLVWLKADGNVYTTGTTQATDGQSITTWADASGNNNDATQANAGMRPIFKTNIQNGLSVIRFDGVDDVMGFPVLTMSAGSLFIVFSNQSQDGLYRISSAGDPNTYHPFGSTSYEAFGRTTRVDNITTGLTYTNKNQITVTAALNQWDLWCNGVNKSSSGTNTPTFGDVVNTPLIGDSGNGSCAQADFCEMIIYSSSVGTTDRQNVESYLKTKWGTP